MKELPPSGEEEEEEEEEGEEGAEGNEDKEYAAITETNSEESGVSLSVQQRREPPRSQEPKGTRNEGNNLVPQVCTASLLPLGGSRSLCVHNSISQPVAVVERKMHKSNTQECVTVCVC